MGETVDISGLPNYAEELAKWRVRMVQQFEHEGRGSGWTKDGQLVQRLTATTYSPFYPPAPPAPPLPKPKAGAAVAMFANGATMGTALPCGTNDCWIPRALDERRFGLQLVDNADLCLSFANGSYLDVEKCAPVDTQHFSISNFSLIEMRDGWTAGSQGYSLSDAECDNIGHNDADLDGCKRGCEALAGCTAFNFNIKAQYGCYYRNCSDWFTGKAASSYQVFYAGALTSNAASIKHVPSGRCIAATKVAGEPATVQDCDSSLDSQMWLLESSRRFCAWKFGGLCLRADQQASVASHSIYI